MVAAVTLDQVSAPEMTRPRLRKDAERNRQRVIEAARELFALRGLEATLNDVAHHAGLGVGTVYRRFPTKEELLEAVFEDAINQLTALAESALRHNDSWQGFVWFVEQMCEVTATDRGAREMAFSRTHGGDQVEAARVRLVPQITKLVERAQQDGYLRPDLSPTDMPIFGLMTGTVSEFAGHVDARLWRRYVAILLDGIRQRGDQTPLTINALEEEELETAMQRWQPAGPR
jgi:AcrR family transcriptional regulator